MSKSLKLIGVLSLREQKWPFLPDSAYWEELVRFADNTSRLSASDWLSSFLAETLGRGDDPEAGSFVGRDLSTLMVVQGRAGFWDVSYLAKRVLRAPHSRADFHGGPGCA